MKNKIYLIVLALFSICINQYFANRGVFPIDNFLIFDAAFNINNGNHPFKDYWLITGPFLDYIQSLLFLLFGVNWFSYVLHASIINMIFTLFSFYFFINIGLKNYYAFIYSLGISILAYPSIGSPFIDHHSVFFSIMAMYSLSLAILKQKNLFWFLTPVFITISFFSKQIPSSYLLLLFFITFFYFFLKKKINNKNLLYLFLGSFFSFFIIVSIFYINEIPFKNFLVQYILYPLSLGEERIDRLEINFNNLINQFKFIYLALAPMTLCLFFYKKMEKREFIISLFFLSSILTIIYCQLLTKNQILIFSLIPISAALSHAYILKNFNKKYFVYFILIIFIFSTVKYHIRFNHNKKFIELVNANFNLAEDASILDKRLKGIKWITPQYIDSPTDEINLLVNTKNILLENKSRKIIITDYQFFTSLIDSNFASPNKWYDELSIPSKENKYYKNYKNFFLSKINENKIEYMYFIGENKNKMEFFIEFKNKNKCLVPKNFNEILLEFNLKNCIKVEL